MTCKPCVLLIHGLWMGPWAMSWLAHELRKAEFETEYLALRSTGDTLDSHIDRLARAVSAIDAETIHLLGHSLGGVIILRYLKLNTDQRIGRALLLGAPALGSQAAKQFDRQAWGSMLGASREIWRSPFEACVPDSAEVGAIAGDHAFGLGIFFASLNEPNDGAVTVAETQVGGLRDHIVLPVSHSGMLLSGEVAKQSAVFFKTGSFER
ncbi:MAG: esterase/lipase family protein [Burkholderiales bacterium]